MVTCNQRDLETDTYKRFPKLVIEVLSKSTEANEKQNLNGERNEIYQRYRQDLLKRQLSDN